MLLKDGHDIEIVVVSDADETLTFNGIQVHRVNVSNALAFRFFYFLFKFKFFGRSTLKLLFTRVYTAWKINAVIKKINKKRKIDIVQYPSLASLALFRPRKIRAIVRISSSTKLWKKAQDVKYRFFFHDKLDYFLELKAMSRADIIFSLFFFLAKEFERALNRKIEVVKTPYEQKEPIEKNDSFYQCSLKNKRYFLFAGQISCYKGVKTIADILHEVFLVDDNLYFVFAGKNHCFENRTMMSYVFSMSGNYSGKVVYAGELPHEELLPVIKNAIAVVLPSRVDNIPNICLEAMSLEKIVVGTRGASFEEIIDDGKSGFLIDVDSSKQLLEKLKFILDMGVESQNEISQNARLEIERKFGISAYNDLLDLYRSFVGEL